MPQSRIDVIDALRGFALAGVGLVHFLDRFAGGMVKEGTVAAIDHGPLDLLFRGLLWVSFGKFFALFSLLYGVSFGLMRRSAGEADAAFEARLLWRAVILAGFGLLHQCFYRGDILLVYASLTPLLVVLYRMPARWLLGVAALCFLSVPRLVSFALWGEGPTVGPAPVLDPAHPYAADYTELLRGGSFVDLARVHLTSGLALKADLYLGILGRYAYTFGYFLTGLWLVRTGVFRNSDILSRYGKLLTRTALTLLGGATALMLLLFSQVAQPIDWSGWLPVVALNVYDWTNVAVAALLLVWFVDRYRTGGGRRVLSLFVPYGRMALTNYVGMSVIGTFLLFDWGAGFFFELRTSQLALVAVAVIAVQMAASALWLSYFRHGPLEWVWRSLTDLRGARLRLATVNT